MTLALTLSDNRPSRKPVIYPTQIFQSIALAVLSPSIARTPALHAARRCSEDSNLSADWPYALICRPSSNSSSKRMFCLSHSESYPQVRAPSCVSANPGWCGHASEFGASIGPRTVKRHSAVANDAATYEGLTAPVGRRKKPRDCARIRGAAYALKGGIG